MNFKLLPRRSLGEGGLNTFAEGALLEPVNTVLEAVKRLSLLRGDSVLVAGQDPIGLMFTKILSLLGMKVAATDLLEGRLKLAVKWGATRAFNAGTATLLNDIRAAHPIFDAVVIAVPSDAAVLHALGLVRGSPTLPPVGRRSCGDMLQAEVLAPPGRARPHYSHVPVEPDPRRHRPRFKTLGGILTSYCSAMACMFVVWPKTCLFSRVRQRNEKKVKKSEKKG